MELNIKYHILFFMLVGGLLSISFFFFNRKKRNKYILFMFYFFLFYFIFLSFVFTDDLINQYDLSKYDLNQNGIFEQNEQSVEQKALMEKNDVGINLSPFFMVFASFPIAIISTIIHISLKKVKNVL